MFLAICARLSQAQQYQRRLAQRVLRRLPRHCLGPRWRDPAHCWPA